MLAILLQYLGMLKTFQVCNALCNLPGKGYYGTTYTYISLIWYSLNGGVFITLIYSILIPPLMLVFTV